ncbi:unnamed protein product [Penicillium olsonii]|nr:unnamed protein product [Penicillium olsonii]
MSSDPRRRNSVIPFQMAGANPISESQGSPHGTSPLEGPVTAQPPVERAPGRDTQVLSEAMEVETTTVEPTERMDSQVQAQSEQSEQEVTVRQIRNRLARDRASLSGFKTAFREGRLLQFEAIKDIGLIQSRNDEILPFVLGLGFRIPRDLDDQIREVKSEIAHWSRQAYAMRDPTPSEYDEEQLPPPEDFTDSSDEEDESRMISQKAIAPTTDRPHLFDVPNFGAPKTQLASTDVGDASSSASRKAPTRKEETEGGMISRAALASASRSPHPFDVKPNLGGVSSQRASAKDRGMLVLNKPPSKNFRCFEPISLRHRDLGDSAVPQSPTMEEASSVHTSQQVPGSSSTPHDVDLDVDMEDRIEEMVDANLMGPTPATPTQDESSSSFEWMYWGSNLSDQQRWGHFFRLWMNYPERESLQWMFDPRMGPAVPQVESVPQQVPIPLQVLQPEVEMPAEMEGLEFSSGQYFDLTITQVQESTTSPIPLEMDVAGRKRRRDDSLEDSMEGGRVKRGNHGTVGETAVPETPWTAPLQYSDAAAESSTVSPPTPSEQAQVVHDAEGEQSGGVEEVASVGDGPAHASEGPAGDEPVAGVETNNELPLNGEADSEAGEVRPAEAGQIPTAEDEVEPEEADSETGEVRPAEAGQNPTVEDEVEPGEADSEAGEVRPAEAGQIPTVDDEVEPAVAPAPVVNPLPEEVPAAMMPPTLGETSQSSAPPIEEEIEDEVVEDSAPPEESVLDLSSDMESEVASGVVTPTDTEDERSTKDLMRRCSARQKSADQFVSEYVPKALEETRAFMKRVHEQFGVEGGLPVGPEPQTGEDTQTGEAEGPAPSEPVPAEDLAGEDTQTGEVEASAPSEPAPAVDPAVESPQIGEVEGLSAPSEPALAVEPTVGSPLTGEVEAPAPSEPVSAEDPVTEDQEEGSEVSEESIEQIVGEIMETMLVAVETSISPPPIPTATPPPPSVPPTPLEISTLDEMGVDHCEYIVASQWSERKRLQGSHLSRLLANCPPCDYGSDEVPIEEAGSSQWEEQEQEGNEEATCPKSNSSGISCAEETTGEEAESAQADQRDAEEEWALMEARLALLIPGFGWTQSNSRPSSPSDAAFSEEEDLGSTEAFSDETEGPDPADHPDQQFAEEQRGIEGLCESSASDSGQSQIDSPLASNVNASVAAGVRSVGSALCYGLGALVRVFAFVIWALAICSVIFVLLGGHLDMGAFAHVCFGPTRVLEELRAGHGTQSSLMDWVFYMVVRWLAGDRMTPG